MNIKSKFLAVGLSAIAFGLMSLTNSQPGYAQSSSPQPSGESTTGTPKTQVSEEELQQFAQAVKEVQKIQSQSEEQMIQAVQNEGLTPERFIEIGQSQQSQQAQPSGQISSEEKQNFESARAKVIEIREQSQSQMEQAIQAKGLELSRFNQIALVVQEDPGLQQQVQQYIQQ